MTAQATAITHAILEVLSEATLPLKRTALISKVYEKTKLSLTANHINWLIGSEKIQRTGMGFYQIAKK